MGEIFSNTKQDGLIASGLIASPAWSAWLAQFNELLSTFTLVVGLLLGLARLYLFVKKRSQRQDF